MERVGAARVEERRAAGAKGQRRHGLRDAHVDGDDVVAVCPERGVELLLGDAQVRLEQLRARVGEHEAPPPPPLRARLGQPAAARVLALLAREQRVDAVVGLRAQALLEDLRALVGAERRVERLQLVVKVGRGAELRARKLTHADARELEAGLEGRVAGLDVEPEVVGRDEREDVAVAVGLVLARLRAGLELKRRVRAARLVGVGHARVAVPGLEVEHAVPAGADLRVVRRGDVDVLVQALRAEGVGAAGLALLPGVAAGREHAVKVGKPELLLGDAHVVAAARGPLGRRVADERRVGVGRVADGVLDGVLVDGVADARVVEALEVEGGPPRACARQLAAEDALGVLGKVLDKPGAVGDDVLQLPERAVGKERANVDGVLLLAKGVGRAVDARVRLPGGVGHGAALQVWYLPDAHGGMN